MRHNLANVASTVGGCSLLPGMGKIIGTPLLAIILSLAATGPVNLHAQDRMQGIPFDKLTDAQKKAIAQGTHAPGRKDGKSPMSGSAHYLIRVPELMNLVNAMVDHVHYRSVLPDDRLNELAILLSAREFTQQFQWHNHLPMARAAGLSEEIINAIAEGRRPAKMAEDEEIVYDFCVEVYRTQSVSDATYARTLAKFGEAGIVELVHIQGTYAYLARLFNVLRHPLPPGAKPLLAPFPRNVIHPAKPPAGDRMLGIPFDKLTAVQKKALAEGTHAPGIKDGKSPMTASGHYTIRVPELMPLVYAIGDHVHYRSVFAAEDRLNELIILLSAREFTSQFQWYNHLPMAQGAKLSAEIIDAIADGRRPAKVAEDEEIIYDFCVEVYRSQSVSDATYARALAKFGEAGIVEILHIQGAYAYLARLFNVMRHPLPAGQTPALAPYPRNQ